jgi:hypothetical protein
MGRMCVQMKYTVLHRYRRITSDSLSTCPTSWQPRATHPQRATGDGRRATGDGRRATDDGRRTNNGNDQWQPASAYTTSATSNSYANMRRTAGYGRISIRIVYDCTLSHTSTGNPFVSVLHCPTLYCNGNETHRRTGEMECSEGKGKVRCG